MDEKVAIEALKQIKEVLDKQGIEYWLDMGTLLGAVRDGKFIPWDHDIDLGAWHTQISKMHAVFQELNDRGFKSYIEVWNGAVRILNKDWRVDITLYQLNNGKATYTWLIRQTIMEQFLDYLYRILLPEQHLLFEYGRIPASITTGLCKIAQHIVPYAFRIHLIKYLGVLHKKIGGIIQLEIPNHFFTNLSTITFYGMEFKVPAETEEYLAYRYGKDWKVPKKNYVYYKNNGAIVKKNPKY